MNLFQSAADLLSFVSKYKMVVIAMFNFHLELIIFVYFGQMVYFRWQPTLLQNFIHLRQSAAELLLFVEKSKMAAGAILNYYFVVLDHPRSPFVHPKFPFKFRVDRLRTFRGLKRLFRTPKIMFLESFEPQTLFFIETPQKALPYAETRVLSHKRS